MRRRGDRVRITSGKYSGYQGTVEANVCQRIVDYPGEWSNGYHVMLNTKALVMVKLIVAALVAILLIACSTKPTVTDFSGQRSLVGIQVVNVVD